MLIHIPGTCFSIFFLVFFFDLKIARDDSGLRLTDSDFGPNFFVVKKCVVQEKTGERKDSW